MIMIPQRNSFKRHRFKIVTKLMINILSIVTRSRFRMKQVLAFTNFPIKSGSYQSTGTAKKYRGTYRWMTILRLTSAPALPRTPNKYSTQYDMVNRKFITW